jgi:hypothetical protein
MIELYFEIDFRGLRERHRNGILHRKKKQKNS